MKNDLLTAKEAADRLGVSVLTFYGWLGESDIGTFMLRGQPVTIDYFQGGRNGQGRIKIEAKEVDRIMQLMRVHPRPVQKRKPPTKRRHSYPGIYAELGDPGD